MEEALDAAAVADAVAAVTGPPPSTIPAFDTPPPPLPSGWIMKQSLSNPSYYYYFHMQTGVSTWDPPIIEVDPQNVQETLDSLSEIQQDQPMEEEISPFDQQPPQSTQLSSSTKRQEIAIESPGKHTTAEEQPREKKRQKLAANSSPSSPSTTPSEVRVLHILKKHKESRRPSSWRNPKITATKEEAHEELQGLLDILQEEVGSAKELRATFEELARTESDCSSAKRGGDLGFFGRKKMQPAFEEASFALRKGELTKTIVDTSSGSHIILRIG
jgi:peptidyl-prolyl cis-trans isomerase NIMA-interacting 1